MTFRFSVNTVITSNAGNTIIFNMKEFMKLASPSGPGWSVVRSGDGLAAFSSTGDVITTGGSGAGGINNTGAWFVLRSPNGAMEFLWQRGAAAANWLVLYTSGTLFSGGSATTRASSLGAGVVLGSTTDQATAAASAHFNVTTSVWHYGANDGDGYAFYYAGYTQTTLLTTSGGLFYDEILSGTFFPTIDSDPHIIYVATNSTSWTSSTLCAENAVSSAARSVGILYEGTAAQAFTLIPAVQYRSGASIVIPGAISNNLYTLRDTAFPIQYIHRNGPVFTGVYDTVGYKGTGTYLRWKSTSLANASTLSINTTRDNIVIGDAVLPFSGATPTV